MPLLKLETTAQLSAETRSQLLLSLSKIVAKDIGKPEQYVMVTIREASILMSGKDGDAALVEVRSIGGLTAEVNRNLSRDVCALLQETLEMSPERIYLNYLDISASNWGWNGKTFG